MWYQDPVECIWELLRNPMFQNVTKFAPEKLFEDKLGKREVVNKMWTADWWWKIQELLPLGATVVPVIISSDKTWLSQFQGDKSAWPVYLTIGNISKDIWHQASSRATILIRYLPVGKFDCFTEKAHQAMCYCTFHHCMSILTGSLVSAGTNGVNMTCPNGFVRWVWPILAAYVADYPEQCLVACCMENRCPICKVNPNHHGSHEAALPRETKETVVLLAMNETNSKDAKFKETYQEIGLRPIYLPFWACLPHCDTFQSFTPDLLHQLHKGVFKDHLVKWCTNLLTEKELDTRFKSMTPHQGIWHFKNGISSVSQWMGTEHKAMEKVFVGVVAGAINNKCVSQAARAVVNFILPYLQRRLHQAGGTPARSLQHSQNPLHGTLPHADQMTSWLHRQEAIDRFTWYLKWMREGGYEATEKIRSTALSASLHDTATAVVPAASHTPQPTMLSTNSHVPYQMASTIPAALCGIPVQKIIHNHNATQFIPAIQAFLNKHSSPITANPFDGFDLYKHITVCLPNIPQANANTHDHTPAEPPCLDFALIRTGEQNNKTNATALRGLRVAHVHVLFKLPEVYHLNTIHPLAYVEWYTPFGTLDAEMDMFVVKPSMQSHHVHGERAPSSKVWKKGEPRLDLTECC
ncbi:uncharacterized protein LACBIDRAFT_331514 [Laccaria bicolor S238N-H82]|uniref:Predicted protein n=1 Tax=Laccaria bicolor (strain S238N-H82 / ATCC MYA-4686) TaxID=486041 RepID=B0DPP8_LACBS|nr:uncharacterized protein LACBIDRAFT_331514 [Laccaria bicolor S238N-H82]EDR03415.1 predicted protein [Laccaria bicolor S238N-H82]|eukprot:XP_001885871.1 predicted protein [Laccaria bicolor S238N-H82]